MTQRPTHLERVIADKEALRRQAREKTWPEKVATIERIRDAARLAREGMRNRKPPIGPQ